jgi:hypothetical protein
MDSDLIETALVQWLRTYGIVLHAEQIRDGAGYIASVAGKAHDAKLKAAVALIQTMMENDPDEPVADNGMTVLDAWRNDAKAILRRHFGEDV